MHRENKGFRGLAIRAGLLIPSSSSSSSSAHLRRLLLLSPTYVSLPSNPLPTPAFPVTCLQKKHQSKSPFALFSEASPLPSGFHLSGTHSLGLGTVVETGLHGNKVHLDQLSLRISKVILSPYLLVKRNPCENAKISLSIMTDLHQRNRVTLENMLGTKEDKNTVSCAVSHDFQSQLALGVASSHRLSKTWSLFTRYSKDNYVGKRLFLQAVHELNEESKLSAACTTSDHQNCQAGLSWIHERGKGDTKTKISLKGLCSMDGTFSLSIKAEECSKKNTNISTCRWVFSLLVASGLDSNAFLGDHAIRMFASCGSLEEAKQAFYKVADKSVYTWNALISAHAKLGERNKALDHFNHMLKDGVEPDEFVISCLLKICGDLEVLYKARLMHHHMAYTGLSSDVVLGNSLLYAYAKCGELCDMWDVFCALRVQDLVSWSIVLMGYVNYGHGFHALELYEKMKHDGIRPDKVVFLAVLKASIGDDERNAIISISNGFILHDEVIQNGLESDMYVGSSLLDMYSKCGQVKEASKVFGKLSYPNVVCWNTMISCFAQHGDGNSAFKLYLRMQEEGIRPDKVVFLSILKACSCIRNAAIARLIHGEIQEAEFDLDIMVGSAIIDTYAKCAYIEDAQSVFDRLMNGDSVVWGTMMSGYTHNEIHANTLQLYERMCEEGILISITAYLSALKACSSMGHFDKAMILHDKLIRSAYELDEAVGSCLIDMYSKFGCLLESQKLFGKILRRNRVSCGAMMAGYADNGRGDLVLSLLIEMDIGGVTVDRIVLLYVLKACASMGSLDYARCVHHRVVESEFHLDVVLGNGLIEMYVNCWSLEEARTVFETMPERDIVSWGSIISGYAQSSDNCSLVEHSLKTMRDLGLEPNETIFSSILSACSHNRVLKAACYYFTLMWDEYNVSPSVEHYSCMIDLLGHTGCLLEAEDMLETMPVSPNAIVCTTLLSSCRAYGNSSISEQCFDQFVERDAHQCI